MKESRVRPLRNCRFNLAVMKRTEKVQPPKTGSGLKISVDLGSQQRRRSGKFSQRVKVHMLKDKKQKFGGKDAEIAQRFQHPRIE